MAVDLHPDIVRAIRGLEDTKLYRRYNRYTQKHYHLPGWKVLAKTAAGEAGGRPVGSAGVSSAGARGPTQFIRSTRDAFIQRYGIDPWRSNREAFIGTMHHHLDSGGIAGYNPGMPSYQGYILGQKLNADDRRALRTGAGSGGFDPGRPGSTDVSLESRIIPGQSFAAERSAARRQLLLGGDINLKSLLEYKQTVNGLQDIPARRELGDLQVRRTPGQPMQAGRPFANAPANIAQRGWGGSRVAGRGLVQAAGLPITSRKRSTRNTASGGVSDHWDGNKDSYAWDLGVTGPKGTKIAGKIGRLLGRPDWHGGSWLEVVKEINGVKYRFQVGWNVPDHHDHIHVGVDRVDIPG